MEEIKIEDHKVERFLELLAGSNVPLAEKEKLANAVSEGNMHPTEFNILLDLLEGEEASHQEFEQTANDVLAKLEAVQPQLEAEQKQIADDFVAEMIAKEKNE